MRRFPFRRRWLAVVLALIVALTALAALLLRPVPKGGLALSFREYTTNAMGHPVALVKVQNVSGDYVDMSDSSGGAFIRCEFAQEHVAGRTNWVFRLPQKVGHLGPGEAIVAHIPLPTNGVPVNVAVLARRIPYVRPTGATTLDSARLLLSSIRIRLALRRAYEAFWLEESLSSSNSAFRSRP